VKMKRDVGKQDTINLPIFSDTTTPDMPKITPDLSRIVKIG